MFTLFLFKIKGKRVNAVALPVGHGTIVEKMTEVRTAFRALHFRAVHSGTIVWYEAYMRGTRAVGEARPAGAGIKLRV